MPQPQPADPKRPYLVIPKLIDQPTWGGQYIVETKGWQQREGLGAIKIGQSYELFSGSNLSLLDSSDDPLFVGEITDRDAVSAATAPARSITLSELVASSPADVLGTEVVAQRGPKLEVLIKFTQALGNSFQVHMKAGITHAKWKPKPESWYYFEPGLITLGIKPEASWPDYEAALTAVRDEMAALGARVQSKDLAYTEAQMLVKALLAKYDPWRFVNTVAVARDELVDLSTGGVHHSWEEDADRAPLGNVLYELQAEAMDEISTFRGFDKGKMASDGTIRSVHLPEYFQYIDRTPEANEPESHVRTAIHVASTSGYQLDRLLETPYYVLDKLRLLSPSTTFEDEPGRFKHLFVRCGKIKVTTAGGAVTVGAGHSCFIPAAAGSYTVANLADTFTDVLISY